MIVLYMILAIVLILAAILLINTTLQTRSARKLEGQHPTFTDTELEGYGNTFARMLRCATILLAVAMIVVGAIGEGWRDVLTKAAAICTECVGLG